MSRGITYSHARHFFTALIDHANDAALVDPSVLGELNRNENGMRSSFSERWKWLPVRVINRKAVALNGKEVLRHLQYEFCTLGRVRAFNAPSVAVFPR